MFYYLQLQYKRIYRIINDFGMPPYLGMALIALAFIKISTIFFGKIDDAPILYSGIAILYVFSFGNLERNTFIKTVFSKKDFRKIRLIENLIIVLPFALFLLYNTAFLHALLILAFSGIISLFNTNKKVSFVIPTPFYKHPFEFIIGFRRFFFVPLIAYGLTFIAIKVENFNLGIFALCVIGILVPEFYKKTEPKTFVWIHNLTPNEFLKHKVRIALWYSLWLSLPIHIALWVTFPTEFYITLLFQLIVFCFLIAFIFGKYKHYSNVMLITTGITIAVCLLFPPLFLVIIPYLYKESLTNLSRIL